MLAYARLSPGKGFRPLRAALYYGQRLVVHRGARRRVSNAIAAGVRLACSGREHPRPPAGGSEVSRRIAEEGCAILDPLLSDAQLDAIRRYLDDKEVVLDCGRRVPFGAIPAGTTIADYPLESVLDCPGVLDIANHPVPLQIAHDYLGCLPTISSIGLRWSFAGSGEAADVQRFHRDTDDWRMLKLFVYLTDVDPCSGPHRYVRGSHKTGGRVFTRPYKLGELISSYGSDFIFAVVGRKGTSFMADTYGIHEGAVPQHRPRLMLEVGYSLLPVFAYTYSPVRRARRPEFDPYINRLLLG